MIEPALYQVSFDGTIVRRAFWLYVFEAITAEDEQLLYVGRTGDSSSFNAQSAYNRLGQHLRPGASSTTNQMRKSLEEAGVDPESCRFRFLVYGPVLQEAETKDANSHYPSRDKIAAMEKELQVRLSGAGYRVLKPVSSTKELDEVAFQPILEAFTEHFQKLATSSPGA